MSDLQARGRGLPACAQAVLGSRRADRGQSRLARSYRVHRGPGGVRPGPHLQPRGAGANGAHGPRSPAATLWRCARMEVRGRSLRGGNRGAARHRPHGGAILARAGARSVSPGARDGIRRRGPRHSRSVRTGNTVMNNSDELNSDNSDLDRLLHAAGPRVQPPQDLERDVRAAVHQEWRSVVAARARRRSFAQVAIAAGLGAVALTVWLLNQAPSQAVVVASIERAIDGGTVRSEDPASEQPLAEKQVLHAGDTLATGASGGALI